MTTTNYIKTAMLLAPIAEIAGQPYGPTTSHMFIVAPLTGGSLTKQFSTHPPLEERIRQLVGRQ